jgi:hypothetical protein
MKSSAPTVDKLPLFPPQGTRNTGSTIHPQTKLLLGYHLAMESTPSPPPPLASTPTDHTNGTIESTISGYPQHSPPSRQTSPCDATSTTLFPCARVFQTQLVVKDSPFSSNSAPITNSYQRKGQQNHNYKTSCIYRPNNNQHDIYKVPLRCYNLQIVRFSQSLIKR